MPATALPDVIAAPSPIEEFPLRGAENRVLLDDVPWDVYCALRDGDRNRGVRMTYDDGSLEIVSPSFRHESNTGLLGRFVETFTEEFQIPVRGAGATTLKLVPRKMGLESDRCFYIQNEAAVRGLENIDLSIHPPPDLAAEIDISSPSLSKLPIYEAMKVPEVWQWRNSRIRVLVLGDDGHYAESAESRCLPGFPLREAERLMDQRDALDDNALVRAFREFVRKIQQPPA